MCVINGRNYLRVSHRQVHIVASCLIIVITKDLEVAGVHFWNLTVRESLYIFYDLSIVLKVY